MKWSVTKCLEGKC